MHVCASGADMGVCEPGLVAKGVYTAPHGGRGPLKCQHGEHVVSVSKIECTLCVLRIGSTSLSSGQLFLTLPSPPHLFTHSPCSLPAMRVVCANIKHL